MVVILDVVNDTRKQSIHRKASVPKEDQSLYEMLLEEDKNNIYRG